MIAEFVPVDVPINLAIAVAWKTATQPTNEIPLFAGARVDATKYIERLEGTNHKSKPFVFGKAS